ncbi:hypothetical protein LX15_002307 [Streptoalloteichus tenebrarius]|uniref:Uncharacterized protein n=1 Tax=Streptoalloteichus tenebrarius (strain ATCC 17920 / DSM 40477 / JCM 4838 / CBS 697.72 / NBRC 16177 / NCIMB 11028 / NRRL B-12390 / A12253. 1 / ISP 5477) TaxID=1933 RepID=A0ABT1HSW2_STRSD|nr:hypothetical protein [Streptoalloteichus tenebrarius]
MDRSMTEVAASYARLMGWPVVVTEKGILLPLSSAHTALSMPEHVGVGVLAGLRARMLAGPVLAVPGPQPHWIFLAELVALLPTQLTTPADVRFVRAPHQVLLPPSQTEDGPITWANPPTASRRWFPPFTAVLAVARTVSPEY